LIVAQHVGGIERHAVPCFFTSAMAFSLSFSVPSPLRTMLAAVQGQSVGDAEADARSRAGDDGGLAFEAIAILFLRYSCCGVAPHPAGKKLQRCYMPSSSMAPGALLPER